MSGAIPFTPSQRQAIQTVDRSVLVSAAAGAGKTAVLAERCAYLVCEAPQPWRCDADRLLVVTFTEAAAAEMKERIHRHIRMRLAERPGDRGLRRQLALLEDAQISTLHAFCLWLTRRWFHRLGIDAGTQLLDDDEGRLLRRETLAELFEEWYLADDGIGPGFRELVEDYGLGVDSPIAAFVMRLVGFVESLPDPEAWLRTAADTSPERMAAILESHQHALRAELERQASACSATAESFKDRSGAEWYAERIAEYAEATRTWASALAGAGDTAAWTTVIANIGNFEFVTRGSPRKNKDMTDAEVENLYASRDAYKRIRERLHGDRLKEGLAAHSPDELATFVEQIGRYLQTIAAMVLSFRERYAERKRSLGVMDFSDLEHFAYRLLTHREADEAESPAALEMRARFAHVLVDEFQDINPLQSEILRQVSREIGAEPDGRGGNLFVVGDVKQSIYRFRLAEPAMFIERCARFRNNDGGRLIDLQHNFRSDRGILESVNLLFGNLMREELGGVAYDERAHLVHPQPESPAGPPVELHVLDRVAASESGSSLSGDAGEGTDTADSAFVDPLDPLQWKIIEREAAFIAQRIQQLRDEGATVCEGDVSRPIALRDICILLRSPSGSAELLAQKLNALGVPAWADLASGLFDTTEIRDILSLLHAIDNVRQDIPLASVLRSGVLGERFDEDALAVFRAHDRSVPFHEAVLDYAESGKDEVLRGRLNSLLKRLNRFRREMRARPVAEVLWMIYRQTGYLGYVQGLRGGAQRKANLVALHERARQFGTFRRQGLRRFLAFIESLQDEGRDLGAAPSLGGTEDVVRIMSIHRSKGLEFPVVFLAELGRLFNLQDARGRYLYERDVGIGLKAVDRERMLEWPTALSMWCVRQSDEMLRGEELRVLYVALTRARERLILVGTAELKQFESWVQEDALRGHAGDLLTLLSGRHPLQWVSAAVAGLPSRQVDWKGIRADATRFAVRTHDADEMAGWAAEAAPDDTEELYVRVAALASLPENEPVGAKPDDDAANALLDRLEHVYPHLAVASVPATRAASEPTRRYADIVLADDTSLPRLDNLEKLAAIEAEGRDIALRRGLVVHAALELIRPDSATSPEGIARDLDRLAGENLIEAADIELVDIEALVWFFGTELGGRLREDGVAVHREWMFQSTAPVAWFDENVIAPPEDRILVRGVIDCLLVTDDGLEIVDYKTDRIAEEQTNERAEHYGRQLRLYAEAAEAVFRKPVRRSSLVFLHPRRIVTV